MLPFSILKKHQDTINSVAWNPAKAKKLVSGAEDANTYFWDIDYPTDGDDVG